MLRKIFSTLAVSVALTAPLAQAEYQFRMPITGLALGDAEVTTPLALSIAGASLPEATQGVAYSFNFEPYVSLSGTDAPQDPAYTWSVSGPLPSGMVLNSSGVLSGAPNNFGTFNFSVTVEYAEVSDTRGYSLQVIEPLLLTLSGAVLPDAVIGQAYTQDLSGYAVLTGTHAPQDPAYTWIPVVLPSGFSLSSSGVLSGTPTMEEYASMRIYVNYLNLNDTALYSLRIIEALAVQLAPATLPDGQEGQSYSFDFASLVSITGTDAPQNPGYTWSVSGPLPEGLTLNGTGVLSGTPTDWFYDSFEVVALHEDAEGRQVYTLFVNGEYLKAVQISAGDFHACAITPKGAAKCWGWNAYGQLGDNSTTQRNTPVFVSGLESGVSWISATDFSTCAVHNGAAKCWGDNSNGQLGDGTLNASLTPVPVANLSSNVTHIAAGGSYGCAIQNGAAKCWGYNNAGQLGDGTFVSSPTPVPVVNMGSNVTHISVGSGHACAIHGGVAKCWGSGIFGKLGVGEGVTTDRNIATEVEGLGSNVTDIVAGLRNTCAIHNGAAKCWGAQEYGLGDGVTTVSGTPIDVVGLSSGATRIAVGRDHTCAIHNGAAKCWGSNVSGRLGDGTQVASPTPIAVDGLSTNVTAIVTGTNNTCALHEGGVVCWGAGARGQLGDGTGAHRYTPVKVLTD